MDGPRPGIQRQCRGAPLLRPPEEHYRQQTLTQEEMIGRYISHIPAKHFKMVRYYGFFIKP
uniref:transposase n=1 Tax=Kluyvera intermedia TaxID=61648 RepID=UPI00372D294B